MTHSRHAETPYSSRVRVGFLAETALIYKVVVSVCNTTISLFLELSSKAVSTSLLIAPGLRTIQSPIFWSQREG
jgi:hypothetical protein